MKLEICANSVESALNAQNGGADRIELCTELSVGGVTPSFGTISLVKDLLEIPVYVLIRPRGGDFVYSQLEIEVMKEDILKCAELGCEGVVFGCLNTDRTINPDLTYTLMESAGFMDITFHRAFDEVPNHFEALDTLRDLGIQRVLTSGGQSNALIGIELLGELVEEADEEVIIMPGGGIRPDNLLDLLNTGAQEYHCSAIAKGNQTSDIDAIKKMRAILSAEGLK